MRKNFWTTVLLVSAITMGFRSGSQKDDWQSLFNGKDLSGWDTYLGPLMDDSGHKINNSLIGLNKDPQKVFTVLPENGEGILRISGENFGGISTKQEFENFHLQLMFKWGNLTWGPKKGKKKDSGLLYFAVGPHGADYGNWMRSQEFQIEETNCGDYWGVAGGGEDIRATMRSDSLYVYDPQANLLTFNESSKIGRHCVKRGDAEKTSGEWNTLDLYCHGDTSVHVINGIVMMILSNSQQIEKGKTWSLTKGKLQIQSEGAEVYYQGIRIKPISSIPTELFQ